MQSVLFPVSSPWRIVSERNKIARALADRHYSRKTPGHHLFVGPGERLILLSYDEKALFVWRYSRIRRDGQEGIECTIFRNEGNLLSSYLILEAEKFAIKKWPWCTRLFTYVDPTKIRSTNPGFCFMMAGWKRVKGYASKYKNLVLLEKIIEDFRRDE